tara:strand:+ start:192 stop:617 length:426 start_codon:yes stop_codon:yes gene_type:complete
MDYLPLSIFIIIISIIIILSILYTLYFTKESFYNIDSYKCHAASDDNYCAQIQESNPVVCFIKKLFCVISNLVTNNTKLENDNSNLESEVSQLENNNSLLETEISQLEDNNTKLQDKLDNITNSPNSTNPTDKEVSKLINN